MLRQVHVREAAGTDANEIALVLRMAFAEYEPLYTPAGFAATTPTGDAIVSRMEEGPIWVAIHQLRIVGTVGAVGEPEDCYIRGMAVLPDLRGKGLGWELLTVVENFAREHGIRRLHLSTTPFLDGAIRLYRRFGFKRSFERSDDLFGTPLFAMVKDLADEPISWRRP